MFVVILLICYTVETRQNMAQSNDEDDPKRQKITIKLITDYNISSKSLMSGDDIAVALVSLSHVRLDRLHITKIENLECLGCVTNLYLQQNCIEIIENLEALTNLRFLTLAGNKIKKIQNLKPLKQLKFLDLSSNYIENSDANELPSSLLILSLKDNPCTNKMNYRSTITKTLPDLKELDDIAVNEFEDEKDISNSSDEDQDDDDDQNSLEDFEEDDNLKILSEDILARVKIRTLKQNEEHHRRMDELK